MRHRMCPRTCEKRKRVMLRTHGRVGREGRRQKTAKQHAGLTGKGRDRNEGCPLLSLGGKQT